MEPKSSLLCPQEPTTPSHPISLLSILILSSHLHLGLPSDLFLSGFSIKILYAVLISSMHITCPTHLTVHDLITLIIFSDEYKLQSSSLCTFIQPLITSSVLGLHILLSTLFLNILHLCSSLNVRDRFSYPYKTEVKFCML